MMRANLGCGNQICPGWINIDITRTGPNVVAHDLSTGIPLPNESCEVVYHSHVLEHLKRPDAQFFMGECFRVLKPGGRFYSEGTGTAGSEMAESRMVQPRLGLKYHDRSGSLTHLMARISTRGPKVFLALVLLYCLMPGVVEAVELATHYVSTGHIAHMTPGESDLGDDAEHGCLPSAHLCGCCASVPVVMSIPVSWSATRAAPKVVVWKNSSPPRDRAVDPLPLDMPHAA